MEKNNKEFVPYDVALAMKELGFNEICLGRFSGLKRDFKQFGFYRKPKRFDYSKDSVACLAPLYQQAFRWFRERLKDSALEPYDMVKHYSYNMEVSWEEAQDACLRKLIEICQEKTK